MRTASRDPNDLNSCLDMRKKERNWALAKFIEFSKIRLEVKLHFSLAVPTSSNLQDIRNYESVPEASFPKNRCKFLFSSRSFAIYCLPGKSKQNIPLSVRKYNENLIFCSQWELWEIQVSRSEL